MTQPATAVLIRSATPADAPMITSLTGQLGYAAIDAAVATRLHRILQHRDQLVVVAEADGEVCGWLQAHATDVVETGFRCEILGLVVAEHARRKGIGRELIAHAEAWARSLGAETVVVRTNVNRKESHAFYLALGFGHVKTQAVYRKACGA